MTDEARKQITHLSDGREIIARDVAYAPHPHPGQNGRLVPTTGVEHVLLNDSTETNICVECGWHNDNARAVVAHMSGKHSETRGPSQYSDLVMRTIIREVLRAKKGGYRNYAQVAAEALNTLGVKPKQGERFTSQIVSNLYAHHASRYPDVRVRNVIAGPPHMTEAAAKVRRAVDDVPETVMVIEDLSAVQAEAKEAILSGFDTEKSEPLHANPRIAKTMRTARINRIHRMLHDLAQELTFLDREWETLTQKAKAYDKLRETLGVLGLPSPNED